MALRHHSGCSRKNILSRRDRPGMDIKEEAGIAIEGMKAHAVELGLEGEGE